MSELALWHAVVAQAVKDATGEVSGYARNGNSGLTARDQARAREWLIRGGEDFGFVCDLAGLEPAYVRRKAIGGMLR